MRQHARPFRFRGALLFLVLVSIGFAETTIGEAETEETASVRQAHFDLIGGGLKVGRVTVRRTPIRHDDAPCVEMQLLTEARVRVPFFKTEQRLDETWVMGTNGLVAFRKTSMVDGRQRSISGKRKEGLFQFEAVEDGRPRTWKVPREDVDFTTDDEALRSLTQTGATATGRTLDPDRLAVVQRTYQRLADEVLDVGGRKVSCRVVEIKAANDRMKRWFIVDGMGVLAVREDGKDPRGAYSRRATSLEPYPFTDHSTGLGQRLPKVGPLFVASFFVRSEAKLASIAAKRMRIEKIWQELGRVRRLLEKNIAETKLAREVTDLPIFVSAQTAGQHSSFMASGNGMKLAH